MATEEERKQEIRKALSEYIKKNEPDIFCTHSYFAREILPYELFFFKQTVIYDLIETGRMATVNQKWVIKE